ncbi:hypothetical protein [Anditalea andensis]|uniref:Lipoprotein n=1 Tax=Anditalea andensis TaxID=1048983 RepID=A0A074LM76_9BACT|nr:hypothetical protein [Anditalea andensis]KEO74987.1 hypothetical protein EL17_04750 [Anditalea andensis]
MKAKNYIGIIFICTLAISCVTPPDNFPSVPEITFNGVQFVPIPNASDSLIVSVDFRDAEGDLGLNPGDNAPPFNAFNFIRDANGNLITYSNRPPNAPRYNPIDWRINQFVNNVQVMDTIWVENNPDHHNIFVRFFIKRGGNYQEYRWSDPPFFTTFNGRFPRILTEDRARAIEGTIQYGMLSSGWRSIFRNDTIRLDIQIQDRNLNKSNVISTPDFTLDQVTRR